MVFTYVDDIVVELLLVEGSICQAKEGFCPNDCTRQGREDDEDDWKPLEANYYDLPVK